MALTHATTSLGPGSIAAVLLALPFETPFDYRVPDDLWVAPGDIVCVPLGGRIVTGVVWGPGSGLVAKGKLKDIEARVDAPGVPEVSRRFVDWVARYTLGPLGSVLRMVISVPAALRPPSAVTTFALNDTAGAGAVRMTSARQRVMDALADAPPLIMADLTREAGTGPSVVRGLVDAGLVTARTMPFSPSVAVPDWRLSGFDLSAEQTVAAKTLCERVADAAFSVTLIDGVPGSGKTEVYFEAVADTLKAGKQVLVLLPEIALSAQWMGRFRNRFGVDPVQWHSDLKQSERRDMWRAVADGRVGVVVGARSSLFLPFPDLGLIIVDEEHDASFKQEEGVRYHARDMAVLRARLGNIPIGLASATPSLETVVNVQRARYGQVVLPLRHGGAQMPETKLIDMRKEHLPATRWISGTLTRALQRVMDAGEQAMLFLNRRGYAPLTLCRKCGHRLHCPRCTAWLVEHRLTSDHLRLQCHHCGFSARFSDGCPECKAENSFAACGPGVERLAEELGDVFPDVRIAVAASDTLTGPRAAEELVHRMENHDIDIVVGTQIIAKGYHFPLLTLVGVVDADLGLAGGELRAAERTFQLLYQVAGRAGRAADKPGKVLVQTHMPDHPVMAALVSNDREAFLDAERDAREVVNAPPFGRWVSLIVSSGDEHAADAVARDLARNAPRQDGIRVLGPAPAPMALLRGKHRRRLLMMGPPGTSLQNLTRQWLAQVRVPGSVRVQVDIDPVSFL